LGFELRTSHLLGRYPTTFSTPPALTLLSLHYFCSFVFSGLFPWKDVEFCQGIFCIYWDKSLILFMCYIMFIDLHLLNSPCIPGMKPTWS
jgi:hypothetical protein